MSGAAEPDDLDARAEPTTGRSRHRRLTFPHHRRVELRTLAVRSRQVVLLAAVTGAVTGLIVVAFDRIVVDVGVEHVLELPLWLMAVVPGLGLLVALAIRRFLGRGTTPATADEYLHAFHDPQHRLGTRDYWVKMLASMATLGTGGPMGLEGPSIYTGAVVGSHLQRRFPGSFRDADRRVLLVAGAAAGVAAIFKAPATGAVFALEVPYRGDLARRMLAPALVASASGYLVFAAINGTQRLFPISGAQTFGYLDLVGALVLGLLAGVGARLFAWGLRRAKQLSSSDHTVRTTVAAAVVIAACFVVVRLLTGESLTIGPGYQVLTWASQPDRSVWILLAVLGLRCAATSATVAGGGVGGLFVPLVVAGALLGVTVGQIVDANDVVLFVVVGVAAFLGAGYRVPLAAVMFVAETTGRPAYVVPGLIAAVAAELMMGDSSVTTYQRDTRLEVVPTAADGPD